MTNPSLYVLLVPCMACNREKGQLACKPCCAGEDAQRAVGEPSRQLALADPALITAYDLAAQEQIRG